ncbi:MAG TPA: acetolactate synthase small subunit [Bacteroidales bacterium]|nr:acetolactate synthase small subunit [Bacteroidales bacterium]
MNNNNKKLYTLIVHSENIAGILNQVTAVFTRRQVNIESLNVSASSIPGIHRYTITAMTDSESVAKIAAQIKKKVDVLQCQYYTDSEIFMQEVALYKVVTGVLTDNPQISSIIRKYDAKLIEVNSTFSVIEKTGRTEDITALNKELSAQGAILQFVSSGRVAITRARIEHVSEYLDNMASRYGNNNPNGRNNPKDCNPNGSNSNDSNSLNDNNSQNGCNSPNKEK